MPGDLVGYHEISRETLYRRMLEFEQLGFIENDPGGEFRTTRAGWLALQAYTQVSTRLGVEPLAYLAGASSRRTLIRTLTESPADKSTLAADPELPSRSTIHRTLAQFDGYGWLARTSDGRSRSNQSGALALEQLEWLYTAITEAIEKAPALRTMAYWADPALHTLVGSELLTRTPGVPNTMLNAVVDASGLRSGEFERLQAVAPAVDSVTYERFSASLSEANIQLLLDQRAYRHLSCPRNHHRLATLLTASTIDVRVHPDPLYTVLAIFNNNRVLVGGSMRTGRSDSVVGTTVRLKNWATTTFETLWAEGRPVDPRLRIWIKRSPTSASK